MQWLDAFKIALITQNWQRIEELNDALPSFETLDEMYQAQALLNEAITLYQERKLQLKSEMQKNRKTKKYLA
ncbi:MAG: hypothetical protein KU37_08915 [Sulfuricurvum sp. PC08-66]|nr:MAG: hypothetical protein KU37_08915 [Sulfuricurvum sp. PC08-66]